MLGNLYFGICRVYLSARYATVLSSREHPGAMIRDWFGSALKHSVCPFPQHECRDACQLPGGCAYSRLFQPTRAVVGASGRTGADIPRPFIIEPPLDEKSHYASGEMLAFNLVLVGMALSLFPFAVAALRDTARLGLMNVADEMAPWRLDRIVQISHATSPDGMVLFSAATPSLLEPLAAKSPAALHVESMRLPTDQLTLDLLTPLRLIVDEQFVQEIDTGILCRALLRRIRLLSLTWCGAPLDHDYRHQIDEWCGRIQCQGRGLVWEEWRRHSARRDKNLRIGGLRGEITMSGDLTELRLCLKLGEYLHLGKDTVLGMGRYVCR